MGGIVASQVAEQHPERIKTLVYLSAYLLRNGETLYQIAGADSDAKIGPYFVVNEAQGTLGVREDGLQEAFFFDCSAEDITRAKSLYRDEPLAPLATPVAITPQNFDRVPRVYIETLHDRVVSPIAQKKMYRATPCDQVLSLETGHASFLAAPEKLVSHLNSLTK